jgi:Uncharacterized protein conserved in bacteria
MNTGYEKRARRITLLGLCVLMLCAAVLTGSMSAYADTEEYVPPQALVEMWKLNRHVIGGLDIPGTPIRYPILQHPAIDDYYLNICLDGTEGYPGSIYTNKMEGQRFDTFNTVIYGHNMQDGSYFGSLKNFLDPDYLAGHREIDIYAIDAKHVYDIFAVVIYNEKRITDYFPDEKLADRQAFLDSLREEGLDGSIYLNDVPVDLNGHMVTLSTCITDMHDNRLLIVAYEREE